jgi:hypothetical protein
MSEESVALVRRAYETWNEHGPAAIEAMLAEDVELHDAPELPDADVWRGRAAVIGRLEAVAAAVGSGSGRLVSFRVEHGEIVVTMLWQLDAEADDVELGQVFHVVRVAGAAISRIRVFLTESEALRAAGS